MRTCARVTEDWLGLNELFWGRGRHVWGAYLSWVLCTISIMFSLRLYARPEQYRNAIIQGNVRYDVEEWSGIRREGTRQQCYVHNEMQTPTKPLLMHPKPILMSPIQTKHPQQNIRLKVRLIIYYGNNRIHRTCDLYPIKHIVHLGIKYLLGRGHFRN